MKSKFIFSDVCEFSWVKTENRRKNLIFTLIWHYRGLGEYHKIIKWEQIIIEYSSTMNSSSLPSCKRPFSEFQDGYLFISKILIWIILFTFPYPLLGGRIPKISDLRKLKPPQSNFQDSNYISDQMESKSKKRCAKNGKVRSGSVGCRDPFH